MTSSVFDRYQSAISTIYGRMNYERAPDAAQSVEDFRLSRMADLLRRLGDPQLQVPTVHITGSKGKGSTSTMVARMVQAAGRTVGLFTSPHVSKFEERFSVNQELVSESDFVSIFDALISVVQEMDEEYPAGGSVTFFEIATAMAWMHFARSKCDLAVMEVGLGGRLDSTNICSPIVTAITSISRDHTRLLGETLEEIAAEKAGILKKGVCAVTAVVSPGPFSVIQSIANELQVPVDQVGVQFRTVEDEFGTGGVRNLACSRFDYFSETLSLQRLQLAMPGAHQVTNAAVAIRIVERLRDQGITISDEQIRLGLMAARCPLRVEVVETNPLTIVDTAHNVASIEALCETIRKVSVQRKIVIFATSRDKEFPEMLQRLDQCFDEIWLTKYLNNPRAVRVDELEQAATQIGLKKAFRSFADPASAVQAAQGLSSDDVMICYTGSFFLAAEVKDLLDQGR